MPPETQPVVDAPSAEAEEFEITLPEGEVGQEFLRAADAADEDPDAEPKPDPSPAAKADDKPTEKKGNVTAALHEERDRRKRLTRENESLKRDRERWKRIEEEEAHARDRMAGRRSAIEVRANATKVAADANAKESMGEAAVVSVEEAARMVNEAVVRLKRDRVLEQEDDMRDLHEDYDTVVKEAGFFEATQLVRQADGTVTYANPRIAAEIYGSSNPPRTAYRLARAKLASAADAPADTEDAVSDEERDPTPAPTKPKAVAAKKATVVPATPTEDELAEAEGRGERRAIARVLDNATKPRGLRVIADAGKPTRVRITAAWLDDLYERNPAAWERTVKSDPVLQRRYFGGE